MGVGWKGPAAAAEQQGEEELELPWLLLLCFCLAFKLDDKNEVFF